jgi:hypothetical protein
MFGGPHSQDISKETSIELRTARGHSGYLIEFIIGPCGQDPWISSFRALEHARAPEDPGRVAVLMRYSVQKLNEERSCDDNLHTASWAEHHTSTIRSTYKLDIEDETSSPQERVGTALCSSILSFSRNIDLATRSVTSWWL